MNSSSCPSGVSEVEAIPDCCFVRNKEFDEGSLLTAKPLCDHERCDQGWFDVTWHCHTTPQQESEKTKNLNSG